MTTPTPLYEAIMWEVRKLIMETGITMAQCDELSGTQDGYTSKMLHPATKTGRQAHWDTVQLLLDALYPEGFKLRLVSKTSADAIKAALARKLEARGIILSPLSTLDKMRKRHDIGKIAIRDFAREAGQKSARSRMAKLSPRKRRSIARRAARARWRARRAMVNPSG